MSALPDAELAAFFQVHPSILHLVPELLTDVWALGSDPEQIVRLLQPAGLTLGARVLDLGCGKGAVSLAVAEAFAATVDGTDAFAPFVADAVRRAEAVGLTSDCCFWCEDVPTTAAAARGYDAVLYVSLGHALGSAREAIATLRRTVRTGGLIVFDGGYLAAFDGGIAFPRYGHLRNRRDTLCDLVAFGDRLVEEQLIPADERSLLNRTIVDAIEVRADALARRYPGHAAALADYVAKERAECEILDNRVHCATWIIERTD